MHYLIALGAAVLAGCVLVKIDTSKAISKNAHLQKLDNNDISCGEAFETLELLNSWGDTVDEQ